MTETYQKSEGVKEAGKRLHEEQEKEKAAPKSVEELKETQAKTKEKKEEKKEEKAEKKEEKKREIILERVYSIPFLKVYSKPRMKRGNAAIRLLKEFVFRHFKTSAENLKISPLVVQKLLAKGSKSPLKKLKVVLKKDKKGLVSVELA